MRKAHAVKCAAGKLVANLAAGKDANRTAGGKRPREGEWGGADAAGVVDGGVRGGGGDGVEGEREEQADAEIGGGDGERLRKKLRTDSVVGSGSTLPTSESNASVVAGAPKVAMALQDILGEILQTTEMPPDEDPARLEEFYDALAERYPLRANDSLGALYDYYLSVVRDASLLLTVICSIAGTVKTG
ncbi:hypothetical protein C8R44DRAFT_870420 [Mycena epipterygia]|nr:hypothetical protein C8R44DRAFT_870420 [Mycena epipterygia]